MLEDIRLGLKIWDNQNDVDTQTTDMRSIVYQTAADFEMRSIEHVRTMLSLIDKYKEALEEIIDIDGNNKATYAQDVAYKALKKE